MTEVTTWNDLYISLSKMTDEQRQQPIQCSSHIATNGDIIEMLPGIAFGTMSELELCKARSTHNNKFCGDDHILLLDYNQFSVDGAIAYDIGGDFGFDLPIYTKDGPTSDVDQTNPEFNNPKSSATKD